MKWTVRETLTYEVEADSEESALQGAIEANPRRRMDPFEEVQRTTYEVEEAPKSKQ
jgi:hypothetical protein